jgi:hypothetical protein
MLLNRLIQKLRRRRHARLLLSFLALYAHPLLRVMHSLCGKYGKWYVTSPISCFTFTKLLEFDHATTTDAYRYASEGAQQK